MRYLLLFITCFLIRHSGFAQPTFHKDFEWYAPRAIAVGPDNTCHTVMDDYFSSQLTHLMSFDANGVLERQLATPSIRRTRCILQDKGRLLIVGDTAANNPQFSYGRLLRVTPSGNIDWALQWEDAAFRNRITAVIASPGGYIVSGGVEDGMMVQLANSVLIRLDSAGNTLWSKRYTWNIPTHFNSFTAQYVSGDTIFACGMVQGNACFLRFSLQTGELIGQSIIGGLYHDEFSSLCRDEDGNFILMGTTRSTTGSEESRPWAVKFSPEGVRIWSKTYDLSPLSVFAWATAAPGGGIVACIAGDGSPSIQSAALLRIGSDGALQWAYNYSGGHQDVLRAVVATPDNGFAALTLYGLLKTDAQGRIANGCCPELLHFETHNYSPNLFVPVGTATNWITAEPFTATIVNEPILQPEDYCQVPITSISSTVSLCAEETFELNGQSYHAPATVRDTIYSFNGGCDTVRVFHLIPLVAPIKVENSFFCPGDTLWINGTAHTQPDTLYGTIPVANGCDTLFVHFLQWKILPVKHEYLSTCPGDTVWLDGLPYTFPVNVTDTLPGIGSDCDTVRIRHIEYPWGAPSALSFQCPEDMIVNISPGESAIAQYNLPSAGTTCSCDTVFTYLSGPLPGTTLQPGEHQVCFTASDVCSGYGSCCFTIKVEEIEACDLKDISTLRFELIDIVELPDAQKRFRVRVRNTAGAGLQYLYVQLPQGLNALSPVNNAVYTAPGGRTYTVRHPNTGPFRSIRFQSVDAGIAAGQQDIFAYTLPLQADPAFIRIGAKLANGAYAEATLSTFQCDASAATVLERNGARAMPEAPGFISPNPGTGVFTLHLPSAASGNVHFRLSNLTGQTVLEKTVVTENTDLQFTFPAAAPAGIYLAEWMLDSGERHVEKLIFQPE